MAENMGKGPSGHGQLTKIRLSDGCGGKASTTAAQFEYDCHGFEGYLGNVGYIQSSKKRFYGDVDLARRVTDKFLFKEWLREKGCETLVVPTLAVYDDVNEVRNHVFDRHTILKPTHLSGAVIPFYESRKLTVKEISKLEKWMDTDYYRKSREKTYKGVRKRLICELLLLDSTNNIPMDYKFSCVWVVP